MCTHTCTHTSMVLTAHTGNPTSCHAANFKVCGNTICASAPAGKNATQPASARASKLACPKDGKPLAAGSEGECKGPGYNCPTSSCVANKLGTNAV